MWKNNRPEDWKNPFQEEVDCCKRKDLAAPEHQLQAFEAGADAILEALKRKSTKIDTSKKMGYLFDTIPVGVKGYLAFIPDEKA